MKGLEGILDRMTIENGWTPSLGPNKKTYRVYGEDESEFGRVGFKAPF